MSSPNQAVVYFRPAIRSFLRELVFFCIGLAMYLFPLLMLNWVNAYLPEIIDYISPKLIFVTIHYVGISILFWATLSVCIVILANRFKLTADYVESEWGIIARKTARVELNSIRTVNVNQGIIERLLGVGVISFSSAGTSGQDVIFSRIKYPVQLQALVNVRRLAASQRQSNIEL